MSPKASPVLMAHHTVPDALVLTLKMWKGSTRRPAGFTSVEASVSSLA